MRKWTLVVAAIALASCGKDKQKEAYGLLDVEEPQLDFGASCPKPENPAYDVTFPVKTLVVHNIGASTSTVNLFAVEAAMADVFVIDPSAIPQAVESGDSVEVPITFKPKKSGTVVADLTIQGDRPDDEDKIVVKLLGQGKAFDPVPRFSASCLGPNTKPANVETCADGAIARSLRFADTAAGGFTEAEVTIKNGGCPDLKLTNIAVATTSSDDNQPGFALAPGQATSVSVLGGNAAATIKVHFKPVSPNSYYRGTLTFTTNDPLVPTVSIELKGDGTAAQLYLDKPVCNFSSLAAPCDGKFTVHNAGGKELTITKVSLQSGNALFTIPNAASYAGQKVGPAGTLATPIVVEYVPSATKGSDYLVVESDAGSTKAELRGGSPPVIATTPTALIDFGTGLAHLDHFAALKIDNVPSYSKQVDLVLQDIVVGGSNPTMFSVMTAATAGCPSGSAPFTKGMTVKVNESYTACVRFQPDEIGGKRSADLRILSNDPTFPAPGYLVQTLAESTCVTKPIAIVEVREKSGACPCTAAGDVCPATASCSVSLPQPPAPSTQTVELHGGSSYASINAPGADGVCAEQSKAPVDEYEWTLAGMPSNASPSDTYLTPSGKTTSPATTLTFAKVGTHLIKLKVYKDGKVSTSTSFTVTGK